jgi:hypothetical protein
MTITTVGLDLAKSVFQVHCIDGAGAVILRKKLRRSEVLGFFHSLGPCRIGMEACATAHFWAREIGALGHDVRMMPPSYVKAYLRRQKNDAADAEAICEAVTRPSMRFVPVKSAERQSVLVLHRSRELLVRQRTMLVNAIRGHCAEFGLIAPLGVRSIPELLERVRSADPIMLPEIARLTLTMLADQLDALAAQVHALERGCSRGIARTGRAKGWRLFPAWESSPPPRWPPRSATLRCFAPAASSPPSWAWSRARTPPAARTGSAASPRWRRLSAQAAGGGRHLGGAPGQERHLGGGTVGPLVAGAQTHPRGHRGHGQQDRPYRLGLARTRRRLSGPRLGVIQQQRRGRSSGL